MITNEQNVFLIMNTKHTCANCMQRQVMRSGIVSEIVATDQHINCFLLPEVSSRKGAHGYRFIDCMSCS